MKLATSSNGIDTASSFAGMGWSFFLDFPGFFLPVLIRWTRYAMFFRVVVSRNVLVATSYIPIRRRNSSSMLTGIVAVNINICTSHRFNSPNSCSRRRKCFCLFNTTWHSSNTIRSIRRPRFIRCMNF